MSTSAYKYILRIPMSDTRELLWRRLTAMAVRMAAAILARIYVHGLGAGAAILSRIDRMQALVADEAILSAPPIPFRANRMAPDRHRGLRIAVGLATVGRPVVAAQMLDRLARQTRRPDAIIVAIPTAADLDDSCAAIPDLRILIGSRGLTRQRNAILGALQDADLVCFFDDDFVADDDYLAAIVRAFEADPMLMGATGLVLADGITRASYEVSEAQRIIAGRSVSGVVATVPIYNAYGCNMVFRCSAIRDGSVTFDEALPAYGWLEDVDFSRQIARFGPLARIDAAVGVHLGVKSGRQSGRRFGYSQIANPVYLVAKGTFGWPRAVWLMGRNLTMNLLRSLWPEPQIDRRGRVAGNLQAFSDLLRGRMHPSRIADMP